MKSITIKYYLIVLLNVLAFSVKAQQLDIKTETEIADFVKKETKYLHALKFKKYYKNFNDVDDFVRMFEGDKIYRDRVMKVNKREIKRKNKKDYSRFELTLMTPFEEFFNDFSLYILAKKDIEKGSKKALITELIGTDITKIWNPKIKFTKDRYLICLLPNADLSNPKDPYKHGEFMLLQILEKKANKWKVYSSWK